MKFRTFFKLLQETFSEWQKDKAAQLAAALAYYTVFSLTPVLIIVIAIVGSIFGEKAARGQIVGQIQYLVGQSGADVIQTVLDNAGQPEIKSFASIVSVIILIIGATGVFVQLQEALNQVWNVKAKPKAGIADVIRKRILSFSMVLIVGFLLLVSLIISAALSALNNIGNDLIPRFNYIWTVLNFIISFGVTTFLFAFLYKYLPDVLVRWRDIWMGAMITAVLFLIGQSLIGMYLGRSSLASTYGAAGSLVVLLAWIYYSAQILLFGAEFTQVYARRYGSNIKPNRHAVINRP